MSTNFPLRPQIVLSPGARVAVIAARFNAHIVDALLSGCVARLVEHGLSERVSVYRVPGAFELPVAAKLAAMTKRYQAVVCIGCVIRGDTPHFDYVAGETARGIQQVAIETAVPIIFGVLTVNTEQQALDRTDGTHSHAGVNAADAAVEMIALAVEIRVNSH